MRRIRCRVEDGRHSHEKVLKGRQNVFIAGMEKFKRGRCVLYVFLSCNA